MNIPRCPPVILSLILCLATGFIAACSSTASVIMADDPPSVVVRIQSAPALNPDHMGRPSPIVIRLYTLKSGDIFNNADFFALYEQDTSILGDDLITSEELEILPGENRVIEERELDMETTHVGVIAAYRDLDNAVWRGIIETPIDETTYIDIDLGSLAVNVKKGEKKKGFLGF